MAATGDCDDCVPSYLLRTRDLYSAPTSTIVFSLLPFAFTWIVTVVIAQRKLFPFLSGDVQPKDALPSFNTPLFTPAATSTARRSWQPPSALQLASLVFSTSIGLSTVLVELLLCEISSTLNPAARGLALRITLRLLLLSNVLIIPALEIHGIIKTISGSPIETASTRKTKPKVRLALNAVIFVLWLLVFWYIPQATILRKSLHDVQSGGHEESEHTFAEACLERIGIIGISLMASLAGFAAVSSLWQTFGVRHPIVNATDIARKEEGLTATEEMLAAKRSRLRALQRKLSEAPATSDGLFGRVMGSFRGNPDVQELKTLEMEVSGLETMRFTLFSSVSSLRSRRIEQERSKTKLGRMLNIFSTAFAIYCAYRICATSLSSVRRWWQPRHSFATSDPINNVLALLTTHWDSDLDRAAWSRQFSFLLSGFMLLLSFNAVLQTFRLFSRFFPKLSQHAQTSLPLMISQVAGTYVISSALLLRSNLPEEVSGVISDALGAPLENRFVDGWFESWFLAASVLTALGILIGRKVGGDDGSWDEDDSIELGAKRS